MNLNEAYSLYLTDPDNYADPFGVELLNFCKAFQKTYTRDAAGETSVSSLYSTDDATNEAVLKVWEHLSEYNPEAGASFSTWVGAIVTNSIKNAFKQHSRRSEIGLNETVALYEPHRAIEDKLTVKNLLAQLDDTDKSFIKLKLAGFSDEQIGREFQQNRQWAWNKWHRLKNKMKVLGSSVV